MCPNFLKVVEQARQRGFGLVFQFLLSVSGPGAFGTAILNPLDGEAPAAGSMGTARIMLLGYGSEDFKQLAPDSILFGKAE